jgi:hypothetical protein
MRTIRAAGGRVATPLGLYVARRPPTSGHFFSQRVRQAYDDFAIPLRIGVFLAIAPLAIFSLLRRRPLPVALGALASVGVAEAGRRRAGGAARFPASSSLFTPAWIAERAVCAWLALGARLRGGVRYGDVRLPRSASSPRLLRRRYAVSPASASRPLSARKPTVL